MLILQQSKSRSCKMLLILYSFLFIYICEFHHVKGPQKLMVIYLDTWYTIEKIVNSYKSIKQPITYLYNMFFPPYLSNFYLPLLMCIYRIFTH